MIKIIWGVLLVIFIVGMFAIPYLVKLDDKQTKRFNYVWIVILCLINTYFLIITDI